jgi:hypothetical protein
VSNWTHIWFYFCKNYFRETHGRICTYLVKWDYKLNKNNVGQADQKDRLERYRWSINGVHK